MSGWYAVFRKEIANFFVSPIAYAVIACFLLITGFFFWANVSLMSLVSLQAANNPMISQRINMTDIIIRPLAQNMSIILLFLMPLLTMRLFSEEKKSGSIELLMTYPITDTGVVCGKFLSAACVLVVMLGSSLVFPLLLLTVGEPDLGALAGGYVGILLMGVSFVALGMFLSTLSENQIISAAISFGAALLFWVMSWITSFAGETSGYIIRQLSILEHIESFQKGILALSDVSFFVFFAAFFLFLTTRSLETYRWRG
jgi:ABC-2 type transport system permease protein|uniref:ABC transporter permease n=1 Tax=Desulfomonile tiedjei TaxID=2358 RepID=A0A7C4ATN0_9BACT